jgi:hypothetical protein
MVSCKASHALRPYYDLLCIPIWVLIIPDSPAIALWLFLFIIWAIKEAVRTPETSACFNEITRCYASEGGHPHELGYLESSSLQMSGYCGLFSLRTNVVGVWRYLLVSEVKITWRFNPTSPIRSARNGPVYGRIPYLFYSWISYLHFSI